MRPSSTYSSCPHLGWRSARTSTVALQPLQPHKTGHTSAQHTREDLDGVHCQRLVVYAVDFDDGHRVTVDLERVVRVARDADQSEAVPEMGQRLASRSRGVRRVTYFLP